MLFIELELELAFGMMELAPNKLELELGKLGLVSGKLVLVLVLDRPVQGLGRLELLVSGKMGPVQSKLELGQSRLGLVRSKLELGRSRLELGLAFGMMEQEQVLDRPGLGLDKLELLVSGKLVLVLGTMELEPSKQEPVRSRLALLASGKMEPVPSKKELELELDRLVLEQVSSKKELVPRRIHRHYHRNLRHCPCHRVLPYRHHLLPCHHHPCHRHLRHHPCLHRLYCAFACCFPVGWSVYWPLSPR